MFNLKNLFNYSQLSLTAYTEHLISGSLSLTQTSDLKKAGLVDAQVDQLIEDGWTVVEQSSDTLYGDSGFSATLFHNSKTGESMFAHHQLEVLQ